MKGLLPHTNRLTKHGKKVSWLIASLEHSNDMALLKKFSKKNPVFNPIVIKVDVSNVRVYKFGNTYQYYTPDPILPKHILSCEPLQSEERVWDAFNVEEV